jgi:hypothetical protein
MIDGLKKDKKELEERIEDILSRQEYVNSKNSEEHHNTVQYFENLVS